MKFVNQILRLKYLILSFQSKLSNKQFILLSSILVGLSVGLAVVVLKAFVHFIFVVATFEKALSFKYLYLMLPCIGIFLTVFVVKKILKGKLEKGLSHIHFSIAKKSSNIPKEQMYAQIITSSLTVGLGGSAGLEAPIVLTGAAFGSNYSKTYNLNYKERTLLLACGIAAGISAAFNAPIAGVLFALEVLLIDVSISAFTPLIISAATGALVSKIISNENTLLSFKLQETFDYYNVPFYVLLGVLAGLVSVYHSRVFIKIETIFSKRKRYKYRMAIIGGVILAALIFVFPSLFGEGYESIKMLSLQKPENIMNNSFFSDYKSNEWIVLFFIGVLIFVKSIATAITLGSGGNGGNFAPSLFVGAYLGFFFSRLLNILNVVSLPQSNFTIVGMAGILSGIYHAPLTAIFLIAEITGGYTLMIPLMIVSSISYAISKYFEPHSMDTKLLADQGQIFTNDKDKNILTTINTNSLIENDFSIISPNDTLRNLVEVISKSKRNLFPVLNENDELLGVIILDNIREIIFNTKKYDTILVKELMRDSPDLLTVNEPIESVLKKFDRTGAWHLPVIYNKKYLGFISKSKVFISYREKLIDQSIE